MNNEPGAELVLEQMAVGDASSLRVKWLVDNYPPVGTKLYTHPVKELTDEEIMDYVEAFSIDMGNYYEFQPDNVLQMIRAILDNAQEK